MTTMKMQIQEDLNKAGNLFSFVRQRKFLLLNDSSKNIFRADGVAQMLLQAQQSGELSGVCGRLGDLGGIDAKLDVAASIMVVP